MSGEHKVRVLDTAADLPAVAALLESEVPTYGGARKSAAEYLPHLEWLLTGNPDRNGYPPGWVLQGADGTLSGVHLSVPRLFSSSEGLLPFFFSSYFFVKTEARGMESLGLFLSYRKLAAHGVLVASSANANSAPLWQKLGGREIPDTGHEWLKPLRMLPLAEEALFRRFGRRWRLPGASARFSLIEPPGSSPLRWLRTPEEIAGAAIPASTGLLQPVRSREWLLWKFGRPAQSEYRLYQWNSGPSPVYLVVALSRRGWRGQIRCLQITDAWSAAEYPAVAAVEAVVALHRKDADTLALRGRGALATAAEALGWRRRVLSAPVLWWASTHASRLDSLPELYPDSGA
ncbi:MAG TPA: hypothetical protein VHM91_01430 [Verrucomicrobiales bacterium]|nr:hypothetical protein [Verrucomicrobiales bacterium]